MKSTQKIIIFEGHDMTGKTNIAQALSKALKLPIYKRHLEHNRWFDTNIDLIYGVTTLTDFFEDTKASCVMDRFYPSEYAYAKTFNRPLCENLLWRIDERMSKMNAIIIHCYKQSQKFEEDDQKIIETNKYAEIKKNYQKFLKKTKCKYFEIDTSNENLKEQIKLIKNKLEMMSE